MNIFWVENYVVRSGKQGEFTAWLQTLLKYKEDHPEVFKEVRSLKVFHREFGGISGSYVFMLEFDNMADLDKVATRMQQDEQFMKIGQAVELLYDPAAYSCEIWSTVV